MEIKVLGSVSPYCKGRKNCPGYLITDNNSKILLDCGNGVSRLLNMDKDLKDLNIIISHLHKDHYGDILAIGYASYVYHNLGLLDKKINVYIPLDINLEDFRYLMNFKKENYLNFITYDEENKINIGDLEIEFKRTKHPITTYAINIRNNNKKISYSADTGFDIDNLRSFFKDTDLLICESTFLENQKGKENEHLSAKEAAIIAKESNAKNLLLTHFFPEVNRYRYKKEAKKVFKNTKVAKEKKKIKIKTKVSN